MIGASAQVNDLTRDLTCDGCDSELCDRSNHEVTRRSQHRVVAEFLVFLFQTRSVLIQEIPFPIFPQGWMGGRVDAQLKQLDSKQAAVAQQDLETTTNREQQIQEVDRTIALLEQQLKDNSHFERLDWYFLPLLPPIFHRL